VIPWEAPGPYRVVFSTRRGGVSEGAYASLNLGLLTDDRPEAVDENRLRVCSSVGADLRRLTLNRQVHGARVNRARAGDRGTPGDALWTEERGVPLLALTADCVPIALVRVTGPAPAVAVVHAGWRGLLAGVIPAAVRAVGGLVAAGVGPAIGPCCYEVRADVSGPIRAAFGFGLVRDGRLDLRAAVERALVAAGCTRVEHVEACTACEQDRFYSHRRDGARTGRQGVIALVA
jgi:purine-nucleoside/S-methyl-5'-thioadenosine phosphorylase / adenosine deaminase